MNEKYKIIERAEKAEKKIMDMAEELHKRDIDIKANIDSKPKEKDKKINYTNEMIDKRE